MLKYIQLWRDTMRTVLLIISILLIVIVLLQSNKAESGAQISGGNSDLFSNRKERGSELVITRITFVLGMTFFIISFIMEFI